MNVVILLFAKRTENWFVGFEFRQHRFAIERRQRSDYSSKNRTSKAIEKAYFCGADAERFEYVVPRMAVLRVYESELRRVQRAERREAHVVDEEADLVREEERNQNQIECVERRAVERDVELRIREAMVILVRALVERDPVVLNEMRERREHVDDDELRRHVPPHEGRVEIVVRARQQAKHPHERQIAKHHQKRLGVRDVLVQIGRQRRVRRRAQLNRRRLQHEPPQTVVKQHDDLADADTCETK
jgi:hypothetical protein